MGAQADPKPGCEGRSERDRGREPLAVTGQARAASGPGGGIFAKGRKTAKKPPSSPNFHPVPINLCQIKGRSLDAKSFSKSHPYLSILML